MNNQAKNQAARAAFERHYNQIKETILQVLKVNGSSRMEALYEGKKLHIMVSQLIKTAQAVAESRTHDHTEKVIVDKLERELAGFFQVQVDGTEGVL